MNTKQEVTGDRPDTEVTPGTAPSFISKRVLTARRFYLELQPKSVSGLKVVCGGLEHCRPDYEVRRAGFRYLAIEFVSSGEGRLDLGRWSGPLRPGMAFAYGPGIRHWVRSNPDRPLRKYYLDFVGDEAKRLLKRGPLSLGNVVQVSTPNEVVEILENLITNGSAGTPFSEDICAALARLLILKLSERAVEPGISSPQTLSTYERVRQYMEANGRELKNVSEVAAACHVDVSYLCRLFQRFDRLTPYQFLTRIKMNQATSLLLDSQLQVKQVAAVLGFADPFHFSRVFKRIYGMAPRRFVELSHRGDDSK